MNIQYYFEIIKTKLDLVDEVRRQYTPILAPNFNSFNFWAIDENKVSEILAYFLDPNGAHGQGAKFLKLFLEVLNITYECEDYTKVIVETEFLTENNRRIDIVINFDDNKFLLGVENKIYLETPDQVNQLRDYLIHLKSNSKKSFCVVYLSPKSKCISETSLSKNEQIVYTSRNQLIEISYENQVIECIHQFALSCESERVKCFLLDFEKFLINMYIGEIFMEDKETIIKYAEENIENLEITLKIANTVIELKKKLEKMYYDQLHEISKELNIGLDDKRNFRLSDLSDFQISFSFEEGGLIYGISRQSMENLKNQIPELIQAMHNGRWKTSPQWPKYRLMYSNIDHNLDFWLDIKKGIAKEKAKKYIEEIMTLLKQ